MSVLRDGISFSHLQNAGVVVRLWQLGLEMRPLFGMGSVWVYPVYAGIGASFGYWLQGVETRQVALLRERREALLEKRTRREVQLAGTPSQRLGERGVATLGARYADLKAAEAAEESDTLR